MVEDNLCPVVRHRRSRVHAQCSSWEGKTTYSCQAQIKPGCNVVRVNLNLAHSFGTILNASG